MRQVEKLYVTSTFTKQAAPSGLVGGLIGAGAGGVGTYLVSKGDWRKRLRNALIGAGVGGAGGAGLEYVYRKRTDKAKPAISQKIKNVAADLVIKRELEKARRGAPDARVYVGPETPLTPVDLDREAKELNASRDLAALLEQQNRPEVAAAHQRVLDRVAEADKKMRAIRKAENDHRVAAGHARRRARLDAAAAKAEKARRTVLLSEAIELARDKERERLAGLSPWRRRLHETLTGVPAAQADKDPFEVWRLLNSTGETTEPPLAIIEGYLSRNRRPADAFQLARR